AAANGEQKGSLVRLGGENRYTCAWTEIASRTAVFRLRAAPSGGEDRPPAEWQRPLRLRRLHGSRFRRILGQRKVRPGYVIIRQEGLQVPVLGRLGHRHLKDLAQVPPQMRYRAIRKSLCGLAVRPVFQADRSCVNSSGQIVC